MVIHSLGIGGMERVMAILANRFYQEVDTELHIILIGIKREILFYLPKDINIHKPHFTFNNSNRSLDTLKTIIFLRRTVRKIQPDTILSFGEYWNNLLLISVLGLKFPVFISDRSKPNKNLGKVQNILRNMLYPRASGYIAQTKHAAEIAKKNGWNKNIHVIGNPIQKAKAQTGIIKENIVLSVGRMITTKHFDHLIRVFAEINPKDWKLIIVGGNAKNKNLLEEYGELIKQLGMEKKIVLFGEISDVDQFYSQSKIFTFTSSSEGFPNVIGEAMAAGLPVVSYDCLAGPSEMISDNQDGFLIPLFNDELFKEKLELLMNNDVKRTEMGKMAVKSIRRFDVDQISKKFLQVILTKD